MKEKIILTGLIVLWQIMMIVLVHKKIKKNKEKKIYDIVNITYQIILFVIFQTILWIIL